MQYPIVKKDELFRKGENVFVQKSTFLPQYVETLHSHDFIEIVYIMSGECMHIEGQGSSHGQEGSIYIVNYGVPHANMVVKECDTPFLAFDCGFTSDFIDTALKPDIDFSSIFYSFLFSNLFSGNTSYDIQLQSSDNAYQEMKSLFTKMYHEYTTQPLGYMDLLRAYLLQLIVLIFRQAYKDIKHHNVKGSVDQAIDYINSNYSAKITLQDISKRSYFTPTYFGKLFKESTGCSFSEYLQKVRVEHACSMLSRTDDSIASIAEKTGFSDLKFFYKIFNKRIGTTPKMYRSMQSQQEEDG